MPPQGGRTPPRCGRGGRPPVEKPPLASLVTEYTGAEPAVAAVAATHTPPSAPCPVPVTVPVMDPSCASVIPGGGGLRDVTTPLLTEISVAPALGGAFRYHCGARSGSLRLHAGSPTKTRYLAAGRFVIRKLPSSAASVRLKPLPFVAIASTHAPAAPLPAGGAPASTVPLIVPPAGTSPSAPFVRCGAVTCTTSRNNPPPTPFQPLPHAH